MLCEQEVIAEAQRLFVVGMLSDEELMQGVIKFFSSGHMSLPCKIDYATYINGGIGYFIKGKNFFKYGVPDNVQSLPQECIYEYIRMFKSNVRHLITKEEQNKEEQNKEEQNEEKGFFKNMLSTVLNIDCLKNTCEDNAVVCKEINKEKEEPKIGSPTNRRRRRRKIS